MSKFFFLAKKEKRKRFIYETNESNFKINDYLV